METSHAWSRDALLQSPLFAPLRGALAALDAAQFPSPEQCNALLDARTPPIAVRGGAPLRFVPQGQGRLPFDMQYEPRCYLRGEVQMRERNWHDLFNALVWLAFPRAKAAINARHYAAMQKAGGAEPGRRGAVRDMNTLFDESGVAVACADAELEELLRGFRWRELFWQRRERVDAAMGFFLFGHGLYGKALRPYTGLTGQGLVLRVEPGFFSLRADGQREQMDGLLAGYLDAPQHCLSTRELTPVPLLGVPGWCADNAHPSYYDNTAYFRPGRRSQAPSGRSDAA